MGFAYAAAEEDAPDPGSPPSWPPAWDWPPWDPGTGGGTPGGGGGGGWSGGDPDDPFDPPDPDDPGSGNPDTPWPPGWPPPVEEDQYDVEVEIPETVSVDNLCTVEARILLDGSDTDDLAGHILKVSATLDGAAIGIKSDSSGSFVTHMFAYAVNYSGTKYGISGSIYLDLEEEDVGGAVVVTVEIVSIDPWSSGSDTAVVEESEMAKACRLATTANHGLSGLEAVDSVTPVAGDLVLVWKQSTASQNGIYEAASGGWVKKFSFNAADKMLTIPISVSNGTIFGGSWFIITADNTAYLSKWANNQVYVTAVENHGLSGLADVDDTVISAGRLILTIEQTSSYENGIYIASSGAWVKLLSGNEFSELVISKTGRQRGQLAFFHWIDPTYYYFFRAVLGAV